MKTLGLIGGMSWESSSEYYKLINLAVQKKLGGFHSCQSLLYSVDFAEIERWQHTDDKPKLENAMKEATLILERGGADLIILCTNTLHEYFDVMQSTTTVPLLHIAQASGLYMKKNGLSKPAVLGTRFTMEGTFYTEYLANHFGFKPLIPDERGREAMHEIIYQELVKGIFRAESRHTVLSIIYSLERLGADCVMLACTEIPLLIQQKHVSIPVINTTEIHAQTAVKMLLEIGSTTRD